jgi:uncharacterized membrane protein
MQAIALALHLLATVIWVGGMFFAYVVLRPASAALLEPPLLLPLWQRTFARFFPLVWVAVLVLLASGYFMAYTRYGSQANFPLYVQIMQGLGILMILLFFHVFFAPYRRLGQALAVKELAEAGRRLVQTRQIIGICLLLGLAIVITAGAGRMLGY